jgi:hypothetical protein
MLTTFTIFWVLFLCACAVVALFLFYMLIIPIIVIGLLALALVYCGGSDGRRVEPTKDTNSSQSAHSSSGHVREI